MEIYKRNCDKCSKYYEGYGKFYCGKSCALSIRIINKNTRQKLSISKIGNKNPMKRKELSDKVSKKLKGKHNSPLTEFKKGNVPWCAGKKLSKDHIQRLSESHIGLHIGNKHPMYGKKHTFEILKKISENTKIALSLPQVKLKILRGERHPNWRGGITPLRHKIWSSVMAQGWRKQCLERDNYTCVSCNERGGKLNIDHIIPFHHLLDTLKTWVDEFKLDLFDSAMQFEPLWDINNGRTLCLDCHRQTDTWGQNARK